MLIKTGLKVGLIMMIVISLVGDSIAQTSIRFAPGRTTTTISGSLGKNAARIYTVRGKKGQRITLSVRSGNNYVFAGVEAVGQGRTVTGVLPYDSSYVIELSNGGNATNYTMTISIR
jgi:hypothetical protein